MPYKSSRRSLRQLKSYNALRQLNAAKRLQRFYRRKRLNNVYKRCLNNNNQISVCLSLVGAFTADASGNIVEGMTNDPSGTSQWATYAALWDTYKVHKVVGKYIPTDPADVAAGESQNYFLKIIDQDENPTIDTEAKALEYQGVEIMPSWKCWTRTLYPSKTNEKWEWRDVTATTAQCAMKWVREGGFGDTQQVGNLMITYFITFRGSKL